jgi:hypothetical protein
LLAITPPLHKGKPARSRVGADRRAQGQPARSVGVGRVGNEDDAVVLVGGDGLFTPPLAAEGQPGGLREVQAQFGGAQLHQAFAQQVVEVGDQAGQRARAHALPGQQTRQLADARCQLHHAVDAFGGAQLAADALHRQARVREQIALGDDADQPFVLDHRHVAQRVAAHQERGVLRGVLAGERAHRLAHDLLDGGLQRALRQGHAVQHVVARQDAQHALLTVHHHDRADAPLRHGAQRQLQRHVGADREHLLAHQLGERLLHRLLGQRHVARLPTLLLAGQLQQLQHALAQGRRQRRADPAPPRAPPRRECTRGKRRPRPRRWP